MARAARKKELTAEERLEAALVPEGEQQPALGAPEAPAAVPTRQTKGD